MPANCASLPCRMIGYARLLIGKKGTKPARMTLSIWLNTRLTFLPVSKQENPMYEIVTKELDLRALEEGLNCLYHHQEPQHPQLLKLENGQWLMLAHLLHELMLEKGRASLH